jgi:predicted TIM-barrel fold metal-dependent hydrolase
VAYAGESWTVEDLRPWVEHAINCFGWDRVVWGGDWPVCTLTASLKQWADASDQLFAGSTDAQREKVFCKNAQRIYRV